MKQDRRILSMLAVLLCFAAADCSSRNAAIPPIPDTLPETITSIEMGGFYNGSDLEPRELTQEEMDELNAWLSELSLEHRTYAEGEAPNEVWSGGTSYWFLVNDGEMSFTWSYIDRAYLVYDGEWYEITNGQAPPLGLAG